MATPKNIDQKQTRQKYKHSTNERRRQRTRTMIQAGSLLDKAGLLTSFGIKPGDDLQQDLHLQEDVAELFGALLELKQTIHNKDYSPILWKQRGKKGLSQ
jgi:hypothetical protein